MSEKFLHRHDAPFKRLVWEKIDQVVVEAASSQMSGRRLLHVRGPYGLGLKVLSGGDTEVSEKSTGGSVMTAGRPVQLLMIRSEFSLPVRDVAGFEDSGLPMDLSAVARAAVDCARQEDKLIFNGSDSTWTKGLLNSEGSVSHNLNNWNDVHQAADDIIEAVTRLDQAGFHGPYTLGLSTDLYNSLFRRYREGNMTSLEHVRQIVTEGIFKVPAIDRGGVLLCARETFAHIVLGQDLMAGFVGPSGHTFEFVLFESLALRLIRPESVCVLRKS